MAKGKNVLVPQKSQRRQVAHHVPFETILCTGAEVWHYRYDVKQVFIFPLGKDARKKALDEGPLPFLFRMRVGDAKQKYYMTLYAQDEKTSVVKILPRMQEDKAVFSVAWVWLDRQFLLPKRILLISPDKAKQQDFVLTQHQAQLPGQAAVSSSGSSRAWAGRSRTTPAARRNRQPAAIDRDAKASRRQCIAPDGRMAPR